MVQNAEFVDLVQDDVGEATTQIEYKVWESSFSGENKPCPLFSRFFAPQRSSIH